MRVDRRSRGSTPLSHAVLLSAPEAIHRSCQPAPGKPASQVSRVRVPLIHPSPSPWWVSLGNTVSDGSDSTTSAIVAVSITPLRLASSNKLGVVGLEHWPSGERGRPRSVGGGHVRRGHRISPPSKTFR